MTALTAPARPAVESLANNPRLFEAAFAPARVCVQRARRDITAVLRLWDVREVLIHDVVLTVSELVTNAVQHGMGDVRLRASNAKGQLLIEVTDDSRAPATLRAVGHADTSGRGLLLVSALAQDWGISEDGRTTWCSFPASPGRP
ncbi:serine/threonine-protein kinase RsbW [Streptomyces sp. SAI-170]|uniref:ATP-binding protein n=1 Tax=Streptomyces sp. SAI-170 TaxID=3377729 RepID=UPI003C7D2395